VVSRLDGSMRRRRSLIWVAEMGSMWVILESEKEFLGSVRRRGVRWNFLRMRGGVP